MTSCFIDNSCEFELKKKKIIPGFILLLSTPYEGDTYYIKCILLQVHEIMIKARLKKNKSG